MFEPFLPYYEILKDLKFGFMPSTLAVDNNGVIHDDQCPQAEDYQDFTPANYPTLNLHSECWSKIRIGSPRPLGKTMGKAQEFETLKSQLSPENTASLSLKDLNPLSIKRCMFKINPDKDPWWEARQEINELTANATRFYKARLLDLDEKDHKELLVELDNLLLLESANRQFKELQRDLKEILPPKLKRSSWSSKYVLTPAWAFRTNHLPFDLNLVYKTDKDLTWCPLVVTVLALVRSGFRVKGYGYYDRIYSAGFRRGADQFLLINTKPQPAAKEIFDSLVSSPSYDAKPLAEVWEAVSALI